MSRFTPHATPIADLVLLERHPLGDARGFLERLYCQDELRPLLGERRIVQINRTLTAQAGTVRGLHFQHPPHAELKGVTCLRGAIFDVAVDLRQGSPTFLHWHAERLGGDQPRTLVIPEGFAHGFQTLTDDCELLYLHTAAYCPEAEAGLNALDPRLAIAWPQPITARSARDTQHAELTAAFTGLTL
ncbi:dTDP-4-dehydrorhamnose 3,5-epimerase family protein [Lamprobacter modestohalophilus]|uniref:dTDP-4-dehydrorhamnose 3,5-epimerase family protein n=1 Tax=Lamprobacter modestohalophilus TaxID=1064514 RepID=UPI002ADEEDB1|nr:dTDP-4-dehydrorhamnose 3,5-epimerase family protein [Lamprobacter modestohalophilus]MEA1051628.1 dTDP-4-dehydrorhamnose 3,5-epimerase family protein [Lamprobacter modestohalophilus]